ncbi:MAG: hypothetical protein IJ213_06790 [Bacteroidales bacterium]|nr:hypothetical protein [Bacteroidales bacterium]
MVYNRQQIKMKKFILSLILVFVAMGYVNAQTKYQVTVTIRITKVFYTDNYYSDKAFSTPSISTVSYTVCESSPDKAKQEAKNECSTVCRRDSGRQLGKEVVNGITYWVKEYREVYDASVQVVGNC